jgi:hypothetical protein
VASTPGEGTVMTVTLAEAAPEQQGAGGSPLMESAA